VSHRFDVALTLFGLCAFGSELQQKVEEAEKQVSIQAQDKVDFMASRYACTLHVLAHADLHIF
jgi:hypothetical protein